MPRGTWYALAISGLAAGPAFGQVPISEGVQLYGLITPSLDYLRVSNASATAPADRPSMLAPSAYSGVGNGSDLRMQSATSGLGIRGAERLPNGQTVFFQFEHGFQPNTGTVTGPPNTTRFWNRNTALGIRGDWGSFFGGLWDTPIAWSHLGLTNGVRNPYTGDSSDIFLSPGFNIPHAATLDSRGNNPSDAVFNRRQGNSLQYWTPKWGGFSGRVFYGLPEQTTTTENGARIKPAVLGVGAEYVVGKLMLRYAYQQQRDYFGLAWVGPSPAANPSVATSTAHKSLDTNHRLIARYQLTQAWAIQGTYDWLRYEADGVAPGNLDMYRRGAWSVLALYREGAHVVWGNYGQAADGRCNLVGGGNCNTNDLGASMWSLGYRYNLSKTTDVYLSYYEVRNEANGQYGVFPRLASNIAPGSTTRGLTAGLELSF